MSNKHIRLLEFLEISRSVTKNYVEAFGHWSQEDQWKKIEEEDFEFKTATSRENELEEFWDRFYASLTLMHLKKYSDLELFEAGIMCWNKINNRSCIALHNSKSVVGKKE